MIALSANPTTGLPDIHAAANNALVAGSVFVLREENGNLASSLPDGVHVVLQTPANERLELTTRAAIGALPGVAGTYLNPEDAAKIARYDAPTLRRYTSRDTPWWRSSGTGVLVTGVIAILTAALGVVSLNGKYGFGKSPQS